MVNRFQRALWLAVVVVTLFAFGFAIPMLPSLGPDTRLLAADDTMELTMASVTVPAGWNVNIASSAQGQPVATLGKVKVGVADAIWLGKSDRLVARVASIFFSHSPRLPDIPPDADGTGGEQWEIAPGFDAQGGDPQKVIVLRRDTSVVFVVVRGPDSDVAAVSDAIDSIVASVAFAGFTPNVGGTP